MTLESILSRNIFQEIQRHLPESVFHDSAHDFSHSLRVANNAIAIAKHEGGDLETLVAAALLHDIGNVSKDHPESSKSSTRSSQQAKQILTSVNFPKEKLPDVLDAILCHSYSAGLTPKTHDGRIFQDADRIDGLGAIGIARVFATSATFKSKLYSQDDPFLKDGRMPNDKKFAVDHFYVKLFKVIDTMQTPTGKALAQKRIDIMKKFLENLEKEICMPKEKSHEKNLRAMAQSIRHKNGSQSER